MVFAVTKLRLDGCLFGPPSERDYRTVFLALFTSNRPADDWGKLLGDTAAVTALLDRQVKALS